MYVIKTLTNTPPQTIFEAFSRSFADYFSPIFQDPAVHLERWIWAGVDFGLSYGAFDGEKLVGFILVAPAGNGLFNLATGVVPEARGQRLTERMFATLVPDAKNQGFKKISLEVIQKNSAALKVYHSVGFAKRRSFLCFKGRLDLPEQEHSLLYSHHPYRVLPEHFTLSSFPPSFEQSFEVLEKKKDHLEMHELRENQKLLAYAIFNPTEMNLIIMEARSKAFIPKLLLKMNLQGKFIGMINVDERQKHLVEALESLGLETYLTQYELSLRL